MYLPYDPAMLASVLNMKLRDNYETLDQLCDDLDLSRDEIEEKLQDAGYEYNATSNRFI
jgi:biotin operon repressor